MKKKMSEFLSEIVAFLMVTFSIYLNRCVFVMALNDLSIKPNMELHFGQPRKPKTNHRLLDSYFLTKTSQMFTRLRI